MSYLHGMLKSGDPKAIEKLISKGEYGEAKKEIGDIISGIRSLEAEYDHAKKRYLLLRSEVQRLKAEGVVTPDKTDEVMSLIEAGRFDEAVALADNQITGLRFLEDEYNTAKAAYLLLKNETERIKRKSVLIPDYSCELDEYLDSGRYREAVSPATEYINEIRNVELSFDSAASGRRMLEIEIGRVTGKGVISPVSVSPVDQLILEGKYAEASGKANKLISEVRDTEAEYDSASGMLRILVAELSRLRGTGVIVPFDSGEPESCIASGDYGRSAKSSEQLLSKLKKVESDYNAAENSLILLLSEVKRLSEDGMIIPFEPEDAKNLFDSGEYRKSDRKSGSLLKKLRSAEIEYDAALGALSLLESEIQRVTEKGMIIPYTTDATGELIGKGNYKKARKEAEETVRKIRALESDYDIVINLFEIIRDEIGLLAKRGVIVPFETTELEELIKNGHYHEAVPVAKDLLSRLRELEDDFFSRLMREFERLKGLGIYIPFGTDDIEKALKSGDRKGAREKAEDLFMLLHEIESDFNGANDALLRLKDEIARLRAKGVVVPDRTGEIEELIGNGDYGTSRDLAFGELSELRGIEKDFDSAYDSLEELKSAISAADRKGIVHGIGIDDIVGLLDDGRYREAGRGCRERLVLLNGICRDYEGASDALKRLEKEIKRLRKKGVQVPDETDRIRRMLSSGDFDGARNEALGQLPVLKGIEKDYDSAYDSFRELKSALARAEKKGIVHHVAPDEIESLLAEGKYHEAGRECRNAIIILKELEDLHDIAEELLLRLEEEIKRLRDKGVVVPDDTGRIRELIKNGDYLPARDEAFGSLSVLRGIEKDYDSAFEAYGALKKAIAGADKKGIVHQVATGDIESMLADGNYDGAGRECRERMALLIGILKDYDDASGALKRLEKEIKRLKKKGVLVPDETASVRDLIGSGEYRRATDEAYSQIVRILGIEKDFDDARDALSNLLEETKRLRQKGLVFSDESVQVEEMMDAGEYERVNVYANALLVTLLSSEKDYDAAREAYDALIAETDRLREMGVVIPDESDRVLASINAGEYSDARAAANELLVRIVSIAKDYDAAMESMKFLISEISRIRGRGIVISEDISAIEGMIEKGEYHDARISADSRVLDIRSTEAEYEDASDAYGTLKSESERLTARGVVFDGDHGAIDKLFRKGSYREARQEIESRIIRNKIREAEYESAVSVLDTLEKEIGRLEKKGVMFLVRSETVRDLISAGDYAGARDEAESGLTKLWAAESDYDSAVEALDALRKEYKRVIARGIVISDESGEVETLVREGHYHQARSRAEFIMNAIRKVENDFEDAVAALAVLDSEIARLAEAGVIFRVDSREVSVMIEKGFYGEADELAGSFMADLRKTEIEYTSAMEVLAALEEEIKRLRKVGVIFREDSSSIRDLIAEGEYSRAITESETVESSIRKTEIEFYASRDLIRDLKAEIARLRKRSVVIDEDTSPVEKHHGDGRYSDSRKAAEFHISRIKAVEIEYDSAIEAVRLLEEETGRLEKKGVMFSEDLSATRSMIDAGEYRKAKKSADDILSRIKKVEREYDAAMEVLLLLKSEHSRMTRKGVLLKSSPSDIEKLIAGGDYNSARKKGDAMISTIRETESAYDAAVSALDLYLKEVVRAKANKIPIKDESDSVRKIFAKGAYKDARLESEELVSKVKAFEWEYELTISAYETLKNEVSRMKKEGIVITDDPSQVEEFIIKGRYQQAKSISEGLLSRIKGTEWEYRLAVKALGSLKDAVERIKKTGKKPGVDAAEVEEWIRRGDYRKAKAMAEDMVSAISG